MRSLLHFHLAPCLALALLLVAGCASSPADPAAKAGAEDAAATSDATTAADVATEVDAPGSDAAADDVAAPDAVAEDATAGDTSAEKPLKVFAIAAIADTHITSKTAKLAHYKRMKAAVAWLNKERAKRGIEVVLVLGDIAWSGGLNDARTALEKLTVPYLPLLGDNCIFAGDELDWDATFGPYLDAVGPKIPGFSREVTPTTHPGLTKKELLQNYSLDLHGVHVAVLDVNSRKKAGFIGEQGNIHNHPGGTWPWLKKDLAKLKSPLPGSVLLASHIPMHQSGGALTADDVVEMNALAKELKPGLVHASIAGHYHIDALIDIPALPFPSYVVGSVFAGPLAVHIATATVWKDKVTWQHETLALPGYE